MGIRTTGSASIMQLLITRHRSRPPRPRRLFAALRALTPAQRVMFGCAAALAMFGLTGVGAYASFTASTSATHSTSTARLTLELGTDATSANRLSVDTGAMLPGESYARSVDLINSGTHDLSTIALTTTASPSSLLDTDATNGLQLQLQRCSSAWTESGISPNFAYTCDATTTSVLATRPVIGTTLALSDLTATTTSTTDHLLITVTLPSSADNSFQGLTTGLTLTFVGAQ